MLIVEDMVIMDIVRAKLHLMENMLPQHAHPLQMLLPPIVLIPMELAILVIQQAVILVLQFHVPKLGTLEPLVLVLVLMVTQGLCLILMECQLDVLLAVVELILQQAPLVVLLAVVEVILQQEVLVVLLAVVELILLQVPVVAPHAQQERFQLQ